MRGWRGRSLSKPVQGREHLFTTVGKRGGPQLCSNYCCSCFADLQLLSPRNMVRGMRTRHKSQWWGGKSPLCMRMESKGTNDPWVTSSRRLLKPSRRRGNSALCNSHDRVSASNFRRKVFFDFGIYKYTGRKLICLHLVWESPPALGQALHAPWAFTITQEGSRRRVQSTLPSAPPLRISLIHYYFPYVPHHSEHQLRPCLPLSSRPDFATAFPTKHSGSGCLFQARAAALQIPLLYHKSCDTWCSSESPNC